jgi:hypothetical protein
MWSHCLWVAVYHFRGSKVSGSEFDKKSQFLFLHNVKKFTIYRYFDMGTSSSPGIWLVPNRVDNIPKPGKIYQMIIKYTKWTKNIPNCGKIDQMVIKCTIIFYCKNLQNLPKIGIFGLKINHLGTLVPNRPRQSPHPDPDVNEEDKQCFAASWIWW